MILLASFLLVSCIKEEQLPAPVIHATVSPASGNTTHTFNFDLSKSESRTGRGQKVFSRWDWNGDGNWDTPYTRLLVYKHRYYAPGTWKPRLEMANLDGVTDTMSFSIPVARGYSPPKPALTVTPATGHIYTLFTLDASATRDDEDSLDQLDFRWDYEGDGQWDITFGKLLMVNHTYRETGIYQPRFQVRDPSGLITSEVARINVSLDDPEIFVSFTCIPDSVTDNTPITMDASASHDPAAPEKPLRYRWDWNNDQIWDTEWLNTPRTTYIFNEEYIHLIRLQVQSQRGLVNDTVRKIRVYHKNRNPRSSFMASTYTGNVKTRFRFDCWSTRDLESSPSEMFYRWDFDGDGTWDTGLTHNVVEFHQYNTPGTFRTLLEVQDVHGGRDTCSEIIHISHGANQTGIIEIFIGIFQSYGTVKIGEQWWLSRNLATIDTGLVYKYPYENDWPTYFQRGHLYGSWENHCPEGWRWPTKEDWEKLFANYPDDRLYEALMPGGESDFGAELGGMGTGTMIHRATFNSINQRGYYWSSSKPADPSAVSTWIVTFDRKERQVGKGFIFTGENRFAVRCVKNT